MIDIVVGIPTYNNKRTINYVIRSAHAGFTTFFPNLNSKIVVSDCGSTDETTEFVFSLMGRMGDYLELLQYYEEKGLGKAIKDIFEYAIECDARAIILLDANLANINPVWIKLLVKDVLTEKYDLMTPYYYRYEYEPMITNFVTYPITAAIFGQSVRNPIWKDVCLSRKLVDVILQDKNWTKYVYGFGINVLITILAIVNNFRIAQANLGVLKYLEDFKVNLEHVFKEIVATELSLIETYEWYWRDVKIHKPVPIIGTKKIEILNRPHFDFWMLYNAFRKVYQRQERLMSKIFPENLNKRIMEIYNLNRSDFSLSPDDWSKILIYSILAYKKEKNKDAVIDLLVGLWSAKVASFISETKNLTAMDIEEKIVMHANNLQNYKHLLEELY